jgi:hypothetical protein
MSAGNYTFYNNFRDALAKADVDLNTNSFKALLLTSSYTPNVATQSVLADITSNEVAGGGDYARITLANVQVTQAGAVVTFDSDDLSWGTNVTITAKYVAIYDDTSASDTLVVYADLDSGGGSVSSTSSTFQITNNASGIFTLS